MNSPYLGFNYDRVAVVATLRLPQVYLKNAENLILKLNLNALIG